MKNFELKSANTRQEIVELWPQLKPGFENVLQYATGDQDVEKFLYDLISVNLILWIGTIDGKYCGFATTAIKEAIHEGKRIKFLLINHLYQEKWVEPFLLQREFNARIDKYASELGCSLVKMYTMRNIGKYVKKMGFKESYTEYTREVRHEDL